MKRIGVLVILVFLFSQTAYSQEKTPPLEGKVEHTQKWEENRTIFNTRCRERGEEQQIRSKDTYWSGEKFMVTARANGEKLPGLIHVEILGTEFSCKLIKTGKGYQGEIFDPGMINRWGQERPEELKVRFSANIDGIQCEDVQRVTIDDLEKYWLMHRKE